MKLISPDSYRISLDAALDFFRGNHEASLAKLREEMEECSRREEFEHAAVLRDYLQTLETLLQASGQKNAELSSRLRNFDVLSYYQGEQEVDMALYMVRGGLLLGHKVFHFSLTECRDEVEAEIVRLLFSYYEMTKDSMPHAVYTPFSPPSLSLFREAMALGKKKEIKVAKITKGVSSLAKLTREYAWEHQRFRTSRRELLRLGLLKIKEMLHLGDNPSLIECFDVAIFQGSSPTAASVVFKDGLPLKGAYRHYHLESRPEGNNDVAMMEEVFKRRIARGSLPHLFVVDGGRAQVNGALRVLAEKNVSVPVVGLAKAKTRGPNKKQEERLIIPGRKNPYPLKQHRGLLFIMTSLRDEAHRFSRRLHHKQESKRHFASWIDEVHGVGPKTKKRILEKLDVPLSEMAQMPAEFLARKFRIRTSTAQRIIRTAQDKLEE